MPVIVGGVIEQDGKFLLVQEAQSICRGQWNYPSGSLEVGELLTEGAVRETREECGLEVKPLGICQVGTHRFPHEAFAMVVFAMQVVGGEVIYDTDEILDARWFTYDEIVAMSDQLRNADRVLHAIDNVRRGVIAPMELLKVYENPNDLKIGPAEGIE